MVRQAEKCYVEDVTSRKSWGNKDERFDCKIPISCIISEVSMRGKSQTVPLLWSNNQNYVILSWTYSIKAYIALSIFSLRTGKTARFVGKKILIDYSIDPSIASKGNKNILVRHECYGHSEPDSGKMVWGFSLVRVPFSHINSEGLMSNTIFWWHVNKQVKCFY